MSETYGRAKIVTIKKDFDDLRAAIRSHDAKETEKAWDRCERWVDFVMGDAAKKSA